VGSVRGATDAPWEQGARQQVGHLHRLTDAQVYHCAAKCVSQLVSQTLYLEMIYHGSYKPSSVPLAFEGARSGIRSFGTRYNTFYLSRKGERYHE
jgi:hypothetical protein